MWLQGYLAEPAQKYSNVFPEGVYSYMDQKDFFPDITYWWSMASIVNQWVIDG